MDEFLKLAFNQRRVKEVLNLIFVGSIASYFFESVFFKYGLLDINNYNGIYRFFISGHFIIPFALFYFFWIVTIAAKMILFQVPNVFITRKFGPSITSFLIWYYTSDSTKHNSKAVLPKSKSLEWLIKSSSKENLEESKLFKRSLQSHRALESDYTLILRAFIAITIYYIHLEYFGWITYSICISILLFMWLLQIVEYQLAEIAPYIIRYGQKPEGEKT